MPVYCTVFEILLLIFQNFKRSPCPRMVGSQSKTTNLKRPTCIRNVTTSL